MPDPLPLAAFDAIYIINLPHRTDRLREIGEQLRRVGLTLASPQVHVFAAIRPVDAGPFDSVGARGCFLSHLGVLRAAIGRRNVLVLEDDLDFAADIAAPALPPGWGLFYGGARHALQPTGALTPAGSADPIVCAHFLAVNGPVIAPLVAYLEAMLARPAGDPAGGPMHVDGAYNHFRADHPDVATCIATPELGHQRASRTDIHALRWNDRWPVVRDVTAALRRLKRRRRATK